MQVSVSWCSQAYLDFKIQLCFLLPECVSNTSFLLILRSVKLPLLCTHNSKRGETKMALEPWGHNFGDVVCVPLNYLKETCNLVSHSSINLLCF